MFQTRQAPLGGVRVLEAASGIAGPIASMLLADAGADVICLDLAQHDGWPELPGAAMWNRNKRIVPHERADELLAEADVVVTTSPDTLVNLLDGLSVGAPRDPVHLRLPSWSDNQDGDAVTLDRMAQAEFGIAMRQTSFAGGPIDGTYPFLTYMQGAWGATACVAALIERTRTGRGQVVTVDPLHAAAVVAAPTMVAEYDLPLPPTNVGPAGFNPLFGTYKCADDQWICLGALGSKFQDILFNLLGTEDILDDPELAAHRELIYAPGIRDRVRARLSEACRLKSRTEWLELLSAAGCPVAPVEDRSTLLDRPQAAALGQRVKFEDPVHGATVTGGTPVTFNGVVRFRPNARAYRPDATWHSRTDAGQECTAPEALNTGTATGVGHGPLAGVLVLNLGTVLAGPYAGMLMAALGADVIKVEVPRGDEFRLRNHMVNRGMRSLAIDLRDPRAYSSFLELSAVSHVVLDNFRPGVLARLKIDRDSLAAVNPDIVTSSITGYGGVGPMGNNPGYDPVLQATCGIMRAQGGSDEPVFSAIAIHDVTAACLSAFGACAGLYARFTGNGGLSASTSLFEASVFMQSNELVRFAGRAAAEVGARDYRGPSARSRYYRCADAWIRVHATSPETFVAAGLISQIPDSDALLANALSVALGRLRRDEAVATLRTAGALVAVVRDNKELLLDPATHASGHLGSIRWPDGNETFMPRQFARFDAHPEPPELTAPGIGQHSRTILRAIGVDSDTVAELMSAGMVAERGPLHSVAFTGYR